jgi:hypothetical protein
VRQLSSAVAALVIMLAAAALSERVVPAVASEEAPEGRLVRGGVIANATSVVPVVSRAVRRDEPASSLPQRLPEPLVMLVAGGVVMGLGRRLRAPRHDR